MLGRVRPAASLRKKSPRIDFGAGYRVYFGKDGESIVILLAGGTKKRQDRDIANAHERWADYKQRKSQEN